MRKKSRFLLSPIIILNSTNEAIVGRWIAKRSSLHWTEGIIYRFPFENEKIQKVQEEIHQDYSKKFELVVERIAIKALEKENILRNIKNFDRQISNGLCKANDPEYPGEIDLLGINKEKKILFVIDVKFIHQKNRLHEYGKQKSNFYLKKKNYLSQLSKKVKYVSDNKIIFLKFFDKNIDIEGWNILPAFVGENIHFIAYDNSLTIKMVPIEDFYNFLLNP